MMDQRVRWTVVGFVALMLALGSVVPGQATPVPYTTSFEVADGGVGLPVWTSTGGPVGIVGGGPPSTHSGPQAANFGVGTPGMVLTSTLVTVPGVSYRIDFWLRINTLASVGEDFEVFWNGSNLLGTGFEGQAPDATIVYELFTFIALATSASTSFGFSANVPAGNYRLDDVSVTATPEPASLALLGLGLVGLVGYQWRRRQRMAK